MSIPEQTDPPAPDDSDKAFMAEFEKVIASYAQAANAGKDEDAEQAALQALALAGMQAAQNPTPELLKAAEASDCENKGDWAGAEAAYLQVFELQQKTGNFGLVTKPLLDLSRLYRYLGRLDDALKHARAASDAARRADISTLLFMALQNETQVLLARADLAGATAAAAEAVNVLQPDRFADMMRARGQILLAKCRLAAGGLAEAEQELEAAWKILESRKPGIIPGPIVALSDWWREKANLYRQKGSTGEAAEALTRAIELRRQVLEQSFNPNPYAHAVLADLLKEFASVSDQLGHRDAAEKARAEAQQIHEQTQLPKSG